MATCANSPLFCARNNGSVPNNTRPGPFAWDTTTALPPASVATPSPETGDPGAHDIVIDQIHCGGSILSIPLLILLNATFSYTVTSNGSNFTMSASYNGRSGSKTIAMKSAFKDYDVRWQVGDHQQGEQTSSGTDGGRMTISSLTKS